MKCNQCEACMINGIFCHEQGCPNSNKEYINGEWERVEDFEADQFEFNNEESERGAGFCGLLEH